MRYLTRAWLWLTAAARYLRPPTPLPDQAPPPGLRPELAQAIARRRLALGIPAPGHPPLPGCHRLDAPRKADRQGYERPVRLSPAARRVRTDQSRRGMIHLLALAHQTNARARAEAGAVAS